MSRALDDNDLRALIGLLATLETQLMGGNVDPHVSSSLAVRLHDDGATASADSGRSLRQGLNDLNHRIRYALGEYDSPHDPVAVLD